MDKQAAKRRDPGVGRRARPEGKPSTTAPITEQVTAKEAELKQACEAMEANFDRYAGTSSMRGKQHGIRTDAQIRRGAQLGKTVKRLERELTSLRTPVDRRDPGPVDLDTLAPGCAIRTDLGWYRVVKVNRATVKVEMPPGWDDLIKKTKIVEIRLLGGGNGAQA